MSSSRNQFNSKAVLGALMHSVQHLRGSSQDILMPNPDFKNPKLLNPDADPHGVGIYCIHGTADRNASFKKIAEGLLDPADGHKISDAISGIHLLAFEGRAQGRSIRYFAEQLRTKINNNGHRHVSLMGHSRGGLVAAYYAEHFAPLDGVTVHGAVLINSPVRGAMLAMKPLSSISSSVKEMETNSEFTNKLAEKIIAANKKSKKYFFVASESDSIVHPDCAYLKENCHSLYLVPEHGHLSAMRSTRLIGYLKDCFKAMSRNFFKRDAVSEPAPFVTAEIPGIAIASKPQTLEDIHVGLMHEIDTEFERVKNDMHLMGSSAKLRALKQFRALMAERLNASPATAATIGDVLKKVLQEPELKSGKPLYELIVQPLNGIFSSLKSTPPKSRTFVVGLLKKYNSVPIIQDTPKVNFALVAEDKKEASLSPSPR